MNNLSSSGSANFDLDSWIIKFRHALSLTNVLHSISTAPLHIFSVSAVLQSKY